MVETPRKFSTPVNQKPGKKVRKSRLLELQFDIPILNFDLEEHEDESLVIGSGLGNFLCFDQDNFDTYKNNR